MKAKFRLSIPVIAIMAVAITGIAVLLMRQASGMALRLNSRSRGHLTDRHDKTLKDREDGYLRALHALANVMGDYETIHAGERRNRFDKLLKSALESEPKMIALYTVWKPNAIDGMDEKFIGLAGSSPTGQYATAYVKKNGGLVKQTSNDIDNVMEHITGPNAHKDNVNNPMLKKINGTEKYTMKMIVPITNSNNDEVVGALGCLLDIELIQQVLENTIRTNDEIAVMAMYLDDGTILAHCRPERIGRNMLDADVEFGDCRHEMIEAMKNRNIYKGSEYDPYLDENIRFIVNPFQMGNSNQNLSLLIGVPESYLLKEVKTITGFTIILAVIAVLWGAAVILVAIGFIAHPPVTVSDTLKDVSKDEALCITVKNPVKNRKNISSSALDVPIFKAA
jgi:methyl-accepting chemotaxis protein